MNRQPLHHLFDAMYHGKYQFKDFLELESKKNFSSIPWKNREIYKPSKKLKDFHHFLNGFVFDYIPVNTTSSYAYRKGSNLNQAVLPHTQSKAFFQADFENFFSSINKNLIRKSLEGKETPASDFDGYLDHVLDLITINEKLPIGYSTSPVISNICLVNFDSALELVCKERNLIYTRYADDIILSADDKKNLEDAEDVILNCLNSTVGTEFRINKSKSKLTTVGRKIKLLGLVILPNGDISVDREVRNRVETWLYFYIKDRARFANLIQDEYNQDIDEGLLKLSGLVSYIASADPAYLEKLRTKFGSTVIDSFLHRSAK